ncbi:MAG: sodium-translocating pyrophosphatase [Candidatus Geothermincolia bacterium]
MNTWPYVTGLIGLLGIAAAGFYAWLVLREDPGDETMRRLSRAIQQGAMAFLKREYSTAIWFLLLVAAAMFFFIDNYGRYAAFTYLFGVLCSGSVGLIGMAVSTRANSRTTQAAKTGMGKALKIAFRGGSVTGLAVVGIGLFGISLLYLLFKVWWQPAAIVGGADYVPDVIAAFGLGASSIALFARVGGGIYTKAADVGADLVGKVEAGIPEDDPRNPAVIADNVGDNVGDVAGMGADLYESYVGSIVAPVALGAVLFTNIGAGGLEWKGIVLPLLIAAVGILSSIAASFLVRDSKGGNPGRSLSIGTYGAAIITTIASYFLITTFLKDVPGIAHSIGFFISIVAGLAAGMFIGQVSEIYTSDSFKTVKRIAESSQTGPATTVLSGISAGMASTAASVILLVGAIIGAYLAGRWAIGGTEAVTGGIYGIALAAIGMLSTSGTVVAVDAYGPIADNAGGIAEMSGQPPEVREITDALDSAGNTTAAIAKGFAVASAGVTALALFRAFTDAAGVTSINLANYQTISGLFLGAAFPFLFASLTISAVGKAAYSMVEEVRRQFREIPGLKEGKEGVVPDYTRCVDISTKGALRYMIAPATLAVISPIVIGLWNAEALAGFLAGALVVGFLMAIFMANSGGAWDNAKKYIEAGNLGGKNTPTHAAAVVGDTVGDPFKDTAGPSMNIMIKVMTVIALVFAPLFL